MWQEDEWDSDNGLILNGQIILPELLTSIFGYVPYRDLLVSCSLVCKMWGRIIGGHHLWKMKAKRSGCHIPRQLAALPELPRHVYRAVAVHDVFGSNLLKNADGKEQFKHWLILSERGRSVRDADNAGWVIEDPPKGAQSPLEVPHLQDYGSSSCFATTYFLCQKVQKIDLFQWGITPEIIRLLKPKVHVSEWYAARFDCASRYFLNVELRGDNNKTLGNPFNINVDTVQWAGSTWAKVEHTFDDLQNVRYIVFKHGGKDLQFWAGSYGSKMTAAVVKLVID